MTQNDPNLTILQRRAIRVLLEARNQTVAARRLGVGRKTIYRWLQDPVFKRELEKAEGELIESLTRSILAGSDIALNRIEKLMIGAEFESVQLRASIAWLDLVFKFRDASFYESNIEKIKEDNYAKQEIGNQKTY